MKGTCVVLNEVGDFLSYDGVGWGGSDTQFWSGPRGKAVKLARSAKLRLPTTRVFVVSDYGMEDERREEIVAKGYIGPAFYPNRPKEKEAAE